MSEQDLRLSIYQITQDERVFRVEPEQIFVFIKKISTDRKDFFDVMLLAQDLFVIDAEKTKALLQEAFIAVERTLGSVSSSSQKSLLRWQTDAHDFNSMMTFIKKNAVFAILNDDEEKIISKSLFHLLSFNGEDFYIFDGERKITIRKLLADKVNHTKLVNWLSNPDDWHRWPEFLYERVKSQRISREDLAYDLKIKGRWSYWRKRRVVKLLEKEIKKRNVKSSSL